MKIIFEQRKFWMGVGAILLGLIVFIALILWSENKPEFKEYADFLVWMFGIYAGGNALSKFSTIGQKVP